MLKYYTDTETV